MVWNVLSGIRSASRWPNSWSRISSSWPWNTCTAGCNRPGAGPGARGRGPARRRDGRAVASGVYVNLLSDDAAEGVRRAYPPEKLARLTALKNAYYPGNVFHLNQNIAPEVDPTLATFDLDCSDGPSRSARHGAG